MSGQRILITIEGTRGDAQPYILAARALIEKGGFEVMVAGPGDAHTMAKEFQVPFTRSRLSAQKVFADEAVTKQFVNGTLQDIVKNTDEVKARYETEETKEKDVTALYHLVENWKPDLILASTMMLALSLMVGRLFKVPTVSLTLQHQRCSRSYVAFFTPESTPPFLRIFVWKLVIRIMIRQAWRDAGPTLRKLTGLPASRLQVSVGEYACYHSAKASFLSLIAVSPGLHGECPEEFNSNNVALGALVPTLEQLNTKSFGSEEMVAMQDFLAAGDAPVYFGYGSIICGTSKFMMLLSLRALKLTGERGILCKGWSTMSLDDLEGESDEAAELRAYCEKNVLVVGAAPHSWLFPRCKVVVHHGGAGTFMASAQSGRPTVILPIFIDQPGHARLVNQRGIGVGLPSMQKATPKELAEAISQCINTPSIQEKAKEMGDRLAKEDAATALVEAVKDYMESHVKTGRHVALSEAIRETLSTA
eukprot:Skav207805  [mRNA]  locus=scaffold381:195029:196571:+ [translate_table: standard]